MKSLRSQRGITLVVALIMLVVLTLVILSAITDSNSNLRVTGNMQAQVEATAASQQAIEQVLSNNFTVLPASAVVSVDVNNDQVADYTVNVSVPACVNTTPLDNTTPNLPAQCLSSSTVSNTGIVSSTGQSTAAAQSWCNAQLWEITASTTAVGGSGASTTVHQGASLNVPVGTGC